MDWLPIATGLLVLYFPVFWELGSTIWRTDEHGHGPIILIVVLWLIWRKRSVLIAPGAPAHGSGVAILTIGLLVYVLGRLHAISILQVGALLPILAGTLLTLRGWNALRAMWFPLLFIIFMIPLPGIFVDAVTGPLKQHVSQTAEWLLYEAGYPVGRTGVMLTIGQYQLLVADACSGLNSMFSLTALGLLYLYLLPGKGWLHNAVIIAAILPIAFLANIVRVLVLVLVTYYLGDAAGQGFLHGAAGMVLTMAALLILVTVDGVVRRALGPTRFA